MAIKARRRLWLIMLLIAVAGTAAGVLVRAQGSGYRLPWWTVDGGGGASSGRGYTVRGTAGQPDTQSLTGGGYTLSGGFWRGGEGKQEYGVFLPIILNNLTR